jgi:hypothetical protein
MERLPNGGLQFCRPDGGAKSAVPPPHPFVVDPVANIRAESKRNEIEIDSKTIVPEWWRHPLHIDEVMSIIYEPNKSQAP